MFKSLSWALLILLLGAMNGCAPQATNTPAVAQGETTAQGFRLTSSAFQDGEALPAQLKCQRDGGTGESLPIAWSDPPANTQSFALIMYHYPQGTVPGKDLPNHYWLLWNLSPDLREIAQGNPQSLGTEGSDKDGVTTGYTPPCSPPGALHTYHIALYALSAAPDLGREDSLQVDWERLSQAIAPLTLAKTEISFTN